MIRKGIIWSAVALMAMLAITLWVGANLPAGDQIPVHFDAKGNPDRYGSKSEAMMGLWIILGTTAFISIVLAGIPKIMPREANFEKLEKAYFACWISVLLLMVGVTGIIAWTMLKATSFGTAGTAPIRFLVIGMGLFFVVLGNYLPKTRSNWVIGIRTPWTLSSETTWQKTHRITGRLFLAAGVFTVILALFAPPVVSILISAGSTLAVIIIGVFYSWRVWRTAEDRSEISIFEP